MCLRGFRNILKKRNKRQCCPTECDMQNKCFLNLKADDEQSAKDSFTTKLPELTTTSQSYPEISTNNLSSSLSLDLRADDESLGKTSVQSPSLGKSSKRSQCLIPVTENEFPLEEAQNSQNKCQLVAATAETTGKIFLHKPVTALHYKSPHFVSELEGVRQDEYDQQLDRREDSDETQWQSVEESIASGEEISGVCIEKEGDGAVQLDVEETNIHTGYVHLKMKTTPHPLNVSKELCTLLKRDVKINPTAVGTLIKVEYENDVEKHLLLGVFELDSIPVISSQIYTSHGYDIRYVHKVPQRVEDVEIISIAKCLSARCDSKRIYGCFRLEYMKNTAPLNIQIGYLSLDLEEEPSQCSLCQEYGHESKICLEVPITKARVRFNSLKKSNI